MLCSLPQVDWLPLVRRIRLFGFGRPLCKYYHHSADMTLWLTQLCADSTHAFLELFLYCTLLKQERGDQRLSRVILVLFVALCSLRTEGDYSVLLMIRPLSSGVSQTKSSYWPWTVIRTGFDPFAIRLTTVSSLQLQMTRLWRCGIQNKMYRYIRCMIIRTMSIKFNFLPTVIVLQHAVLIEQSKYGTFEQDD